MQVKSSLTASDFNSFYGDVMQSLPSSSHDQTYDNFFLINTARIIVTLWKCKPLMLNR